MKRVIIKTTFERYLSAEKTHKLNKIKGSVTHIERYMIEIKAS